jgi:GNAT superfamily N-acetyltransferase
MSLRVRQLTSADAMAFQNLRLEGFRLQEREFRYAPADENDVRLTDIAARLERDFVVALFNDDAMVGLAGLASFAGAKLQHKALLWGMYVRAEFRGTGAADRLLSTIVVWARNHVEAITLTVVSENRRAVRFYEKFEFTIYGVEPLSLKLKDGTYLDETLMIRRLV